MPVPRYHTARCILRSGERFLLAIHHNIRPENRGKWGLPGGRVEVGEDPQSTARRELVEELGIELDALRSVGDYEYRGRIHRVFGCEFDGDINEFDRSEILRIGWHRLDEIRALECDGRLHTGFELRAISDYLEQVGAVRG
jgi:8-oxo-dGTP pyrophosphatase MutT (NUDIX family)